MFNFLKKIMPTSDTTPNPLLSITDLIDYASVRPEHVVPAVKSLAAQVEAALEKPMRRPLRRHGKTRLSRSKRLCLLLEEPGGLSDVCRAL